jgi:hypothetical protein
VQILALVLLSGVVQTLGLHLDGVRILILLLPLGVEQTLDRFVLAVRVGITECRNRRVRLDGSPRGSEAYRWR